MRMLHPAPNLENGKAPVTPLTISLTHGILASSNRCSIAKALMLRSGSARAGGVFLATYPFWLARNRPSAFYLGNGTLTKSKMLGLKATFAGARGPKPRRPTSTLPLSSYLGMSYLRTTFNI